MTKLELSSEGYERIMEKLRAIENILNKGFFEPDTAPRRLREASGKLCELRCTLGEVCLLVPDVAGPPGPDAA
jgi:hypothetical protein